MPRRRWPPLPTVEEETTSLSKEIGYERFLTDEDYVPARGTVDQGPIMVEAYHDPDNTKYRGISSSSSGSGSEFNVAYSDLNDSPLGSRGRQVDSSLLDDDSIASTMFTHRSPSPYAYTQSSSSPSSHRQRDNYPGRAISLDDGVADLVRSSPSSPISPEGKASKPFVLVTPESNSIDSCSESECSCCSSCSECKDDVSDGTFRSDNLQAEKHFFSRPSSKRRSSESKVRVPTSSPVFDPTTPSGNGTIWTSPSSRSRTPTNRSTSQTRPELRLDTPNGRKGSPIRAGSNPNPPAEPSVSRRPSRSGHQHSWSCNAISQSPTLSKPQRIVDYGGAVGRQSGHSANLSPLTSPKSGSSYNSSLVNESDGIPRTYRSRPAPQRSQWSDSPVMPSQLKYTTHQQSPSPGSPLSERPNIRNRQNSSHTGANRGTPQIVVQPPAEENVPVVSAFTDDDMAQTDHCEPEYSRPTDMGKHISGKGSPTYYAERPTRVYPGNPTPPRMSRSYSDDPRSRPRSYIEPNFLYEKLISSGDSSEIISPSPTRKGSDGFMTRTADFYSCYDATPLPPCPRTDHAPYNDWFVFKGSKSPVICPGCIQNIIPPYERHRFVQTRQSRASVTMICDFSCSWNRAAWLMASRGRTFDQVFLERISSIKPDDLGCLLRRHLAVGGWYTLRSRHGVQGDELLMCLSCTKKMTAILPSMDDEVKRISRKRINGRPMCVFGPQNQHAALLVGDLVAAQVAVLRSMDSLIDLSQFVTEVRSQKDMREDTRGNGNSAVKDSDDDDSREGCRENRRWHVVPQLTACTVCEECFKEAVWPELEAGHPLAQIFTTSTSGRRGSKSLHGSPYASEASSPSPRRYDRWGRRSYHRRRRSSRHNEFDDDVFGPESSYNQKPDNAHYTLAIAGNGQGIRAGDKDDDGLNRICYLHSPCMRKAWQRALCTNDFKIFEAEVLRLKEKETYLRERIVELKSSKEEKISHRYGNRLGDGFYSYKSGDNTWRNRRNSMGSIDSRPNIQSLPVADLKEDVDLNELKEEWKRLGSIN